MPAKQQLLNPIATQERLTVLDFIRGVAVLGIFVINVEVFAYPDAFSPYLFGFDSELDRDFRFWVYFLFQGKFFCLFSLLFGVSFYLFFERLLNKELLNDRTATSGFEISASDVYARRLLCLFIIGVLHAYLLWNGDILYHYAACGLLLLPFRRVKICTLFFVLLVLAVIIGYQGGTKAMRMQTNFKAYQAALAVDEQDRTEQQESSLNRWNRMTKEKSMTDSDRNTIKARELSLIHI